jgi:hypothetical protein
VRERTKTKNGRRTRHTPTHTPLEERGTDSGLESRPPQSPGLFTPHARRARGGGGGGGGATAGGGVLFLLKNGGRGYEPKKR